MLSTLDDAALLREVLSRSEPAWAELLRRHRLVIERTIARALAHHPEAVEDVFGDLCAMLLERDMRKLRAWDPARGAKFSTWLCLLAIHAARDHQRVRISRGGDYDHDELPVAREATEPTPFDALLERERREILRVCVERLTETEQVFVELYFIREMPVEDIATATQTAVATVYARRHKIAAKLVALASQKTSDGDGTQERQGEDHPPQEHLPR